MKIFSISFLLLFFLIPTPNKFHKSETLVNYIIDPGHTAVTIQVKRFGVVEVLGRFSDVSGVVKFDPEDLSGTIANVVIGVKSYSANNSGGEDAVMSPAFLDVANYSEITFNSKEAYSENGKNYLKGELTVHGTTKEILLPYEITGPMLDLPTQKQSIGIKANLEINRKDYGISFDRTTPDGAEIVGNKIKILLNVLAISG